ncbi:hypothetical protein M9Y10_042666 [Tritrichomonas musculus]|uniref:DUF3447 domain-containing protein n=1 Tax=Tritrichomonas musculus TaxID=1915356 RepID=A0ABR2JXY1_9EUKA
MLSYAEYLKLHHDEIKNVINLQKQVDNLNSSNFQDFKAMIIKSNIDHDKNKLIQLLNMIQIGIAIRPHSYELYFNLLESISSHIKSHFSEQELISIFPKRPSILKLYEKGLISINTIYEQCRIHKYYINYFAPEMKEFYSDFFEANIDQELRGSLNFEDMKKYRKRGQNPAPIAEIIRNDDIELFQNFISKTNTKFDSILIPSEYEQCRFIMQNMNYADYAAFYGSINIFKYLLLNECTLTYKTAQFAVAGGNYEIIHLLEEKKVSFRSCLEVCIQFHQNDIFEYLIENHSNKFKMDFKMFFVSIEMYNTEFFYQNIEEMMKTDLEMMKDSILTLASIHGVLDIVNFICSIKEINIIENSYLAFLNFLFFVNGAIIDSCN